MTAAPVLIPVGAIAAAILALLLTYAAAQLIRPLLAGLGSHVPVVGKYVAQAAAAVEAFVIRQVHNAARAILKTLALFLAEIGELVDTLLRDLLSFFNATIAAIDHLIDVRIPSYVDTVVAPIRRTISTVDRQVDAVAERLGDFRTGIEGRVRQLTETVWDRAIAPVATLTTQTIPALRQFTTEWVDYLVRQTTVVLPREIDSLGDRVGRLRDYVDREAVGRLSAYIAASAPAIAFVTAVAIPEIAIWRRFRPKADRLCTIDLDNFDEFLGLALIIPALPLIIQTVEQGARHADEIMAAIPFGLPSIAPPSSPQGW